MSEPRARNDDLTAAEAAQRLGIKRSTLYQWLADSDAGRLVIRGQPVTIDYFQGGGQGQGLIQIEVGEVQRLKELQRVRPRPSLTRRPHVRPKVFPGITVPLGRPD